MKIAVVAHRKKSLGGGLPELRRVLSDRGYAKPRWYEAGSSRQAGPLARRALDDGADLLFAWGGDGSVQRCVDAIAGRSIALAILPAGTANLLATNLMVPIDIAGAVDVGLFGDRRQLDVGVLNEERFAVMAGVGFDALAMRYADDNLKEHLGRLAYVITGVRATRMMPRQVSIKGDGSSWFKGEATCVLLGQMGSVAGGVKVFPESRPDDGLLDVGVVTAETTVQWARVLARIVAGHAASSPLASMTQGRRVVIRLDRSTAYELDGGERRATKRLRASIEPRALTVCVPRPGEA
jgi:diacylglycerol kinase (ATP)